MPPPVQTEGDPKPETGAVKSLFGVARRALTQRAVAPAPPKKSRRSGEDEKDPAALRKRIGKFTRAARRTVRTRRQRERHARAALSLSNTLDWLNLWRDNAAARSYDTGSAPHYPQTPTNHLSPHL